MKNHEEHAFPGLLSKNTLADGSVLATMHAAPQGFGKRLQERECVEQRRPCSV